MLAGLMRIPIPRDTSRNLTIRQSNQCIYLPPTRPTGGHEEYTPSLPQELYEEIIDNLHGNKPSLKFCSLVCRSWLPRCRNHLHRRLTIHYSPYQDHRSIPDHYTSDILRLYLQEVVFRLGPVYPTEYQAIDMAQVYFKQVMELWPEVRVLEFQSCVITELSLPMLASAPPWIKTIRFQHCDFANAEILLSTVDKIASISDLAIGYPTIHQAPPAQTRSSHLMFKRLNKLEFDMGMIVKTYPANPRANVACAEFLLTHIPFQDLESLEVSRIPHDALILFNMTLKRIGSRLRDLKISFSSIRCSTNEFLDMDGLRYCEMLQYLALLRWHTRRHVNQLSWLLSKLNTRFLSGIVVRCFGGLPVRDELETADVVLSQPSFENLQSIDFVLNSWDNIGGENLRCKLHEGLPTLTARRLVVLEFETNTASL